MRQDNAGHESCSSQEEAASKARQSRSPVALGHRMASQYRMSLCEADMARREIRGVQGAKHTLCPADYLGCPSAARLAPTPPAPSTKQKLRNRTTKTPQVRALTHAVASMGAAARGAISDSGGGARRGRRSLAHSREAPRPPHRVAIASRRRNTQPSPWTRRGALRYGDESRPPALDALTARPCRRTSAVLAAGAPARPGGRRPGAGPPDTG